MTKIDLGKIQKIHCIGIGGVGISSLARLLLHDKKELSGTNDNPSPQTLDELRASGVEISLSEDPKDLPQADLYIYSDAWLTMNPQILEEARTRGVPVLSHFEALGLIANQYYVIAISGAHGKTTTTAMATDVLEAAGLDPTAVIGSLRAKTKSNFRAGKSKYFVVEADEFMRHFLNFEPSILIILNIDRDHLDYYKDIEDIQSAFRALAEKVPESGFVITDPKNELVRPVVADLAATIIDYTKFFEIDLKLRVPGLHNQMNAAAVLALADNLKVEKEVAKEALQNFLGTYRRFEYKGLSVGGALVYDDYAHHPAEIRATLAGARDLYPDKKIIAVFQPHLFSRTKILLNEFAGAFEKADEVILAPIYAAREKSDSSISHEMLAEKVRASGKAVFAAPGFADIEAQLVGADSNTIIITMGAGDIVKVASTIVDVSSPLPTSEILIQA